MLSKALTNTPIPAYFLLRENTLAIDLIGPAEVLRYANRLAQQYSRSPVFELNYITAENQLSMSIGLGLTGFSPLPEALPRRAMVFLIGCVGSDDDFSSAANQATIAWLRKHGKSFGRLLCICTGAILAGHAGLLDGRQCTTHHNHYNDLRRMAPRAHVLENRIFVQDGATYTSAGVTTGIDLTLHVLSEIAGYELTAAVARMMVLYMRRSSFDPQVSPWLAHRNHVHPAIHRVQDAIVANPSHDWNNKQLAEIAHISERHLTRLFRDQSGSSVVDFIHHIRIALAKDLLSQSQLDMERVAEMAGFNSARQLRRIWKKFEALPPNQFRQVEVPGRTSVNYSSLR